MHKRKLPQPKIMNAQVESYVRAVQKGLQDLHVVPSANGWAVKRIGASHALMVFTTQAEAISYGRGQAKNNKAELIVHARNGLIRERSSFGSDLHPPKG